MKFTNNKKKIDRNKLDEMKKVLSKKLKGCHLKKADQLYDSYLNKLTIAECDELGRWYIPRRKVYGRRCERISHYIT